jgi:hypothetical protein
VLHNHPIRAHRPERAELMNRPRMQALQSATQFRSYSMNAFLPTQHPTPLVCLFGSGTGLIQID